MSVISPFLACMLVVLLHLKCTIFFCFISAVCLYPTVLSVSLRYYQLAKLARQLLLVGSRQRKGQEGNQATRLLCIFNPHLPIVTAGEGCVENQWGFNISHHVAMLG